MKIRTDFVTNSSSSSFTVSVVIKDVDGNEYYASSDPEELSAEASLNHNLDCTAEEILNAGSISELANILADSMQDNRDDMDDEEDDESEEMREYALLEVRELRDKLIENIDDLSQIASIKATRTWSAWGEGSSCWAADKDSVPFCELYELSRAVIDEDGEEKEKAKEKLVEWCNGFDENIYSEWGAQFPSGFLGAEVKGSIDWSRLTDDVEEFAKMVVDQELPTEDYAEEITEIDMQNRIIKQVAKYILSGEDDGED